MEYRRLALALLVAGVVLLPGVGYVYAVDSLDGPDRHRSSTVLAASEVNASNDTYLAERFGNQVTFWVNTLEYGHVRDDYRAPNRTRAVLLAALEDGSATTTDPDARADLRAIDDEYAFVATSRDSTLRAVALSTEDGTTTVTVEPASDEAVADAVRARAVYDYDALPAPEQETVDEILNASRGGDEFDGYRPWSDEPLPQASRFVVEKDGTDYVVRTVAHVDDFSFPDYIVLGVVASGLGVLSLLAALVVGVGGWLRRRWRDGGE